MNNNQPTQQEPSFNSDIGHQQQQVQYPYNQQVQYVPYGYNPQQANIYPWAAGMMVNQIPMNHQQVNGVVVSNPTSTPIPIVHQSNDIELQEQPMNQQLIPSSTNQEEPINNTSEPNACTRKACSWKLRCKKHAEQKRFWRSLNRKTWTRLPRAVGVLGILFVVLSIAFFLTIGKSVDNHYLNYRKSQCQINTNAANSIVHFDFDQGLYYVNLNVSVAGNDRRFGGSHNHEQEPNKPEANHQRKSPLAPNTNTYIQRKPSFIMYRVCSSPMQQMAADCRDRILQQTQLTCFVNQQAMKRVERAERFGGRYHGTHKDGEKKPEEPVPQPTPGVEKKSLEVKQPRPDQNKDDRQTVEAEVNSGHHGRFSGQNLIVTRDTVKQEFHRSLHCSVPAFIIVSLIFLAVFIAVGFKVLEGKSKFSFDRFFRQYFKNPFGATGEVYQLDEISSSAVVIQDQNEPKFRTLLSASTLKMENTPRQERLLQKRLSKFWTLMRSTATSANETLFLYEKVARANIGCHAKKKAACNGKRKFGRALCVAFKIFLVLIIAAIVIYTSFKTVSSFTNRRVFTGFLFLDATLAILGLFVWFGLFKRRSVHYIITSQRIAKVIELPFRLKMTLMSVDFSKVKGVWAEENKIHLKTVNSKGVERSGLMFEHVIDPNFVVTLIQQKISNNTTITEPQPTTESVATTTETH